jgi:hypothetical protein
MSCNITQNMTGCDNPTANPRPLNSLLPYSKSKPSVNFIHRSADVIKKPVIRSQYNQKKVMCVKEHFRFEKNVVQKVLTHPQSFILDDKVIYSVKTQHILIINTINMATCFGSLNHLQDNS